jgi:D-glycero-D-manno-heptose 1,7-bisphosphate phosphatase
MYKSVFLDRDGVLIKDVDLLVNLSDIELLPGITDALMLLKKANFRIFVVTNQTVIARGLISEEGVRIINKRINELLEKKGAPSPEEYYLCPHHPSATLEKYRMICNCRKPEPGLLKKAAVEHDLDLVGSFMVGDRITDIIAGHNAGCKTVLLKTGKHDAPVIETARPVDKTIIPDMTCLSVLDAAQWIVSTR